MAPDFIFDESQDYSWVSLDKVQAIKRWNPHNQNALLEIVLELLTMYKNYQNSLVGNLPFNRLQFEYNTIVAQGFEDVQFLFRKDLGEVRCFIPLFFKVPLPENASESMKKSILYPPGLFLRWSTNSMATNPSSKDSVIPSIMIWAPVNSYWENIMANLKLPTWDSDMCTVTYIPTIRDILEKLICEFTTRKRLIDALIKGYGHPLEYDSYNHQKVSFFFDYNSHGFVTLFSIPIDFPAKPPTITISSILHTKVGKLLSKSFNDYPYSPRWPPEEYVERMRAFLISVQQHFKKWCNDETDMNQVM